MPRWLKGGNVGGLQIYSSGNPASTMLVVPRAPKPNEVLGVALRAVSRGLPIPSAGAQQPATGRPVHHHNQVQALDLGSCSGSTLTSKQAGCVPLPSTQWQ